MSDTYSYMPFAFIIGLQSDKPICAVRYLFVTKSPVNSDYGYRAQCI